MGRFTRVASGMACIVCLAQAQSPKPVQSKPSLPFTEEENRDGSRFVWFISDRAGFYYEYAPAKELPDSPAFRRLSSKEMPGRGDIACWPSFSAIYGGDATNEGDLLTQGGRKRLEEIQARLGAPVWLRIRDDWPAGFRIKHRAEGTLPFGEGLISYINPNNFVWTESGRDASPDGMKAHIMFERRPILAGDGVDIRPVLAVVLERLEDSTIDSKKYFEEKKSHPALGSKLDHEDSGAGAIVTSWSYESGGYKHIVLVKYLVQDGVGIQAICDTIDSVYPYVKQDFQELIEAIRFK